MTGGDGWNTWGIYENNIGKMCVGMHVGERMKRGLDVKLKWLKNLKIHIQVHILYKWWLLRCLYKLSWKCQLWHCFVFFLLKLFAVEEYKTLIDKYKDVRNDFEGKMIVSCHVSIWFQLFCYFVYICINLMCETVRQHNDLEMWYSCLTCRDQVWIISVDVWQCKWTLGSYTPPWSWGSESHALPSQIR